MEYENKLVEYERFCTKCKHEAVDANEEPCEECLSNPVNLHSHKPVKFEERDK